MLWRIGGAISWITLLFGALRLWCDCSQRHFGFEEEDGERCWRTEIDDTIWKWNLNFKLMPPSKRHPSKRRKWWRWCNEDGMGVKGWMENSWPKLTWRWEWKKRAHGMMGIWRRWWTYELRSSTNYIVAGCILLAFIIGVWIGAYTDKSWKMLLYCVPWNFVLRLRYTLIKYNGYLQLFQCIGQLKHFMALHKTRSSNVYSFCLYVQRCSNSSDAINLHPYAMVNVW